MQTNIQAKINNLHGAINDANASLNRAKNMLKELEGLVKGGSSSSQPSENFANVPGVYGVFMGDHMVTETGEKILVPENYSSKSALVYGDKLKEIDENGEKKFKQIERVKRLRTDGVLAKKENKWCVVTSDSSYRVLETSVTHFGLSEGDLCVVLVPSENKFAPFAAIEGGSNTEIKPVETFVPKPVVKVTPVKKPSLKPAVVKPVSSTYVVPPEKRKAKVEVAPKSGVELKAPVESKGLTDEDLR